MNLNSLLEQAKIAASMASEEILKVYHSGDFEIEAKDDQSPLTRADQAAHQVIAAVLEKTSFPILSEEGAQIPFSQRKSWETFWLIDPLDGTKEFIKRNGEFTVNIALIHQRQPILGVVQTPVTADLYSAIKASGAQKNGRNIQCASFDLHQSRLKVVASRSHLNAETQVFLDNLIKPEILSKGSSLKLLMVAEGEAHLYPRFAPTMEWDTAAAQIIVEEAGGQVIIQNSQTPVNYNKKSLLNPYFVVQGKEKNFS
jgi:3'(2'), 5'-bisphosphate nucleotidase